MKRETACLMVLFFLFASCGMSRRTNPEVEQTPGIALMEVEILRCEDERNPHALLQMAASLNFDRTRLAARLALAAGRVPSYKAWRLLAMQFGTNVDVAEALAIAARFPDTGFPAGEVMLTLQGLPPSAAATETLMYLDTPEAFLLARSMKDFQRVVAKNLWRAKSQVNNVILKEYYQRFPLETVYSIGRTATRGILTSAALFRMPWHQRMSGCPVADHPEKFLQDTAWQVRVTALRAATSAPAVRPLLQDPNPLVRLTALEQLLKLDPDWIPPELMRLTPREAEILAAAPSTNKETIRRLFQRGGLHAEVSAPFMPRSAISDIMNSEISERARIRFLQNAMGEADAIREALQVFRNSDSAYALEYLLSRKEGVDREAIAADARNRGKFTSILADTGFPCENPQKRPPSFYAAALENLHKYRRFTVVTRQGSMICRFFPSQAPLTCANFIALVLDGYFTHTRIHRVVPAFVTQDGDPSGSGSGGPGYTIRCEYNALEYDRAGRVGMALSGKDTGGSQFFFTHAPAPHLNHRYTIFAQVESGLDVLARTTQYDPILRIELR